MKIKKFVAGLSAAVLAATMMSVSVSAAKLGDVVHPSEEDSRMTHITLSEQWAFIWVRTGLGIRATG